MVAILFGVGAIAQVPRSRGDGVVVAGLVLAVFVVAMVAIRRRFPLGAAAVAAAGMAAYQLVTNDSQMTFEPFAVLLAFYIAGRVWMSRPTWQSQALLVVGLGSNWICFAHQHQATVGNVASGWLLFCVLPMAGGGLITNRDTRLAELQALTRQLAAEQSLVAAAKADDERNRVARELHDVVTHCVSVMVIQVNAAKILLGRDRSAVGSALQHVIASGHEALADLRRITGVWLRRDGDSASRLGLHQLDELVANAARAGLHASARIDGAPKALPVEVDHVAYRLVQEALTNVMKHAAGSMTTVTIEYAATDLEVQIRNCGAPRVAGRSAADGGRGLTGMRERIESLGGRLGAGPNDSGGWTVTASIPYLTVDLEAIGRRSVRARVARRWTIRPGLLDLLFFVFWLSVLEAEALTSSDIAGPRWFNGSVVAGSAAAILVRRRFPLVCFVIVGACSLALAGGLDSGQHTTVSGVYGVVIPLYAVACWATRRWAWVAVVVWAALTEIVMAARGPTLATAVGPLLAGAVAFAAGTLVRAQLTLLRSLRETAGQLADERRDRERLAIASERARLTRALQLAVAEGVEAMVVQAQAALTLLEAGPAGQVDVDCADAMSAVETTGRDVLTQLRHILGVLRHGGVAADAAPQPGVDRIHELVDGVRASGRLVELSVDGDPGTLAAGIDLATYRILEDALRVGPRTAEAAIVVCVRFTPTEVELHVTDPACSVTSWSAPAVQQRVEMFRGVMGISPVGDGTEISVRLPRLPEAAFV